MKEFDYCIEIMLKHEGGYVNHPKDPGGETNYGISKKSYPKVDIKNLTKEEAKKIYQEDYWRKANCNILPWPLNLCVFDTAINMGTSYAKSILTDSITWKGYLLKRSLKYFKIARVTPIDLVNESLLPQLRVYVKTAQISHTFLRGWLNRIIQLYVECEK